MSENNENEPVEKTNPSETESSSESEKQEMKSESTVSKEATEPVTEKKEEKEAKEKLKKEMKDVQQRLDKWGYIDFYDYLTLGVGLYGIIWVIVNLIQFIINATVWIPFGFFNFSGLGVIIIQLILYLMIALFPFVASFIVDKLVKRWPNSFPLHFVHTREQFRMFIIFLGFWSTLLFWFYDGLSIWQHGIPFFILAFVLWADALRNKFKKLPEDKKMEG